MRPSAVKEESCDGVYVHRFPFLGWHRGIQLGELKGTPILLLGSLIISGIIKCIQSVLKYRIDLIHAYWVVPGGFIGMVAGKLTGLPVVVTAADVPASNPDLPTTNLVPTKAVVTSAGWAENPDSHEGLDIALLLLEEDLLDVEVASLPAAGTTYTAGEAFNIAGWGMCCAVAASRALALSLTRLRRHVL